MPAALVDLRPEQYRNFLLILARAELQRRPALGRRIDASDVVQDALLQAHLALPTFNGTTEAELLAWLRTILANKLTDAARHFLRKKRNIDLELRFEDTISMSMNAMAGLVAKESSPSHHVARREREIRLSEALTGLPEDQSEAISMRYLLGCSLEEIAAALGRSKPSVAGLLRRGLANLRVLLQAT